MIFNEFESPEICGKAIHPYNKEKQSRSNPKKFRSPLNTPDSAINIYPHLTDIHS
jgi:hypothetical protein